MASTGAKAVGLVGVLVLAVLATLTTMVVWREVRSSLTLGVTGEVCEVDETLSGFQGWCVQRRHRAGGLFTDELTQVHVVGVQDGQKISRTTYAPWPFVDTGSELDVRFEPAQIVLTDSEGIEVVYPQEYYALD